MPDFIPDNPADDSGNLKNKNFSSDQKFSSKKTFIFIGIISVATLFLGFLKLYQNIHSPFQTVVTLNSQSNLTNEQLSKLDSLKTKDTDSDGLSDYDELYFYGTSPYLKDSDSDGYSDKEEIDSENDPNCPAGLDCTGISSGNSNTAAQAQNGNVNNSLVGGGASVETLRQTLKNAGVPEYILNNTTDEELIEVYNQVINESTQTNTNVNSSSGLSNITGNTNTPSGMEVSPEELKLYLQNLTPDEIRQLLKEYGLSEQELNQVDDETLKAIFLKALEEQNQ